MSDFENDMNELGRRAVACERWRWMTGMSVYVYQEERFICEDIITTYSGRVDAQKFSLDHNIPGRSVLPDLTDPATLGCLLHLVREARPYDERIGQFLYNITREGGDLFSVSDSALIEALIEALESAQ